MIIEALLSLFRDLFMFIFEWVDLPALPAELYNIIEQFKSILVGGVGFLGIFVDLRVLRIIIPIAAALIYFEHAWAFTMFIVRKIPFVGME